MLIWKKDELYDLTTWKVTFEHFYEKFEWIHLSNDVLILCPFQMQQNTIISFANPISLFTFISHFKGMLLERFTVHLEFEHYNSCIKLYFMIYPLIWIDKLGELGLHPWDIVMGTGWIFLRFMVNFEKVLGGILSRAVVLQQYL